MPPQQRTLEFISVPAAAGGPAGLRAYKIRIDGPGYTPLTIDWDQRPLNMLAALQRLPPDPNIVAEVGAVLASLLKPAGWDALAAMICQAHYDKQRFCLTIESDAPEIYALPWELMTMGTGQHLAELPSVLVRRELPGGSTPPPRPDPMEEEGRIVLAWSSAGGSVPLEEHREAIQRACRFGQPAFDPGRDVVELVSTETLARVLRDGGRGATPPVRVLHVLCHGARLPDTTHGFGLLWGRARAGEDGILVSAGVMRHILGDHVSQVRLAVLCACYGGHTDRPSSPLGSVAHELHRAGIASVIAPSAPLSMDGSTRLAEIFYEALVGEPASVEEAFLRARAALSVRDQPLDWAFLQYFARQRDGDDSRPLAICPFRGLRSFDERHARFYVDLGGRLPALKGRIEEAWNGRRPRLQVLAGGSGTGKSSLVRAGLIPVLKAAGWTLAGIHRPVIEAADPTIAGSHRPAPPFIEALHALANAAERAEKSDAAGAGAALHGAQQTPEAPARSLLFIDQFEEVFTVFQSPTDRQRSLDLLVTLSKRHVVLLAFRLDYVTPCQHLRVEGARRLDQVILDERHTSFLTSSGVEGLENVVVEPALKVGFFPEPGLVTHLREAAAEEPGALPLMEYALLRLWEQRQGRQLTLNAYFHLSGGPAPGGDTPRAGLAAILIASADSLFDALPPDQQKICRRLFVQLVNRGDTPSHHARRRIRRADWEPADAAARRAFDEVVRRLVTERRLVVAGADERGAWLEVAHEALLQRWTRLHGWLQEDRDVLGVLHEVRRRQALAEPLTGALRRKAVAITSERPEDVEPSLQAYIRRSRWLALAQAAAGALLLVGVALSAQRLWTELDKSRRLNRDAAYVAAAVRADPPEGDVDPEAAALFLMEIADPASVPEWLQGAWRLVKAPLAVDLVTEDELPGWYQPSEFGLSLKIEIRPDKSAVIRRVGSPDYVVHQCDLPLVTEGRSLLRLLHGGDDRLQLLRCRRDDAQWELRFVDLLEPRREKSLGVFADPLPMAISANGAWIVGEVKEVGQEKDTNRLYVFDTRAGETVQLDGAPEAVKMVTLSAGGGHVLAVDATKSAMHVWPLPSKPGERREIEVPQGATVENAALSPDGTAVAFATNRGAVWLSRAERSKPIRIRSDAPEPLGVRHRVDIEFVQGGTRLVALTHQGSYEAVDPAITVWDVARPGRYILLGESERAGMLATSERGRYVAALMGDRINIWDIRDVEMTGDKSEHRPAQRLRTCADWNRAFNTPLQWSPDGSSLWMYCGTSEQRLNRRPYARVWSVERPSVLSFADASVSGPGPTVVTASRAGTIERWIGGSGRAIETLSGPAGEARRVAVSEDGEKIIALVRAGDHHEIWGFENEALQGARLAELPAVDESTAVLNINDGWVGACSEDRRRVHVLHLPARPSLGPIELNEKRCEGVELSSGGGWLSVRVRDGDGDGDTFSEHAVRAFSTARLLENRPGAPDIEAASVTFGAADDPVAGVTLDGGVSIWSASDPSNPTRLASPVAARDDGRTDMITAVLSPNGKWVAATSGRAGVAARSKTSLFVWKADEPSAPPATLGSVHDQDAAGRAMFTPDSKFVLLSGEETMVWSLSDVSTGGTELDGALMGVTASPWDDGRHWVVTYRYRAPMGSGERFFAVSSLGGEPFTAERVLKLGDASVRVNILSANGVVQTPAGPWLIAGESGDRILFPLSSAGIPFVKENIAASTSACLLPRQRIDYLGQEEGAANRAYAECRARPIPRPWLR
ncbi:nSTAND1 domain-containing NTPase [Sorangium sp. So ce131]|uniref:nSTAND1 domain-containing NTPase n=1 Tax=Sorangium sp. So ce131 TaxID=3133282 RepID=UPI003F63EC09